MSFCRDNTVSLCPLNSLGTVRTRRQLKMDSIDSNDNASVCRCRPVWTWPLVAIQPIHDDMKSLCLCRQVRTIPYFTLSCIAAFENHFKTQVQHFFCHCWMFWWCEPVNDVNDVNLWMMWTCEYWSVSIPGMWRVPVCSDRDWDCRSRLRFGTS